MISFDTTWLPFIIASAVALSLYDLAKKHSVSGNRPFAVLFLTSFSGFASTFTFLAATGSLRASLDLDLPTVSRLALKSLIVGASWSFAYWALKTLPVTVMAPIRATGPVWTTLAAVPLFAEVPTLLQTAGFMLAFGAMMAFSLAARREGFTLRTPSIILAVCATLMGSASALYDKLLIAKLGLPPATVLLWFMGGMTILYAVLALASVKFDATPFEWRWTIPVVGVLLAASDFLYFSAVDCPDARISVLSTIRRSSVIATFVLGGAIFREKNLLRKGLALAVLLLGVAMLCLKQEYDPQAESGGQGACAAETERSLEQ